MRVISKTMLGILGKKIGITNIFNEAGRNVPVTVIEAGPCFVLQVKTKAKEGYDAIQIGFSPKREKVTRKPDMGRFKKAGTSPLRFVRELRVNNPADYKIGQTISAEIFAKGDYLDVVGTSIGKGFQGGVRRWGWKGGDTGHGSMFGRVIGSIQSGARLGRVTKGHHLPGHMGVDRITIQNLEVIDVVTDKNLIIVKGSVPGHKNNYLMLQEAVKRPKGYVKRVAIQASTKKSVKATVKK
ncbi:MAG: 50S ribosomal protein L3 [Candidatus Omnitrophica bacterium]|nr:50S ribosomal protein L3 [Candidatus Omnitrophota bacterium]MBU1037522.1 50S ribosomal protein L3 [Candidatus Omnitrophota bacterium]MBU1808277.1 50S ribosomal protein L3 [Candidatus Omnitrophota bacterium]